MQENHKRFTDKYFETLNAKESAIYAGFSEKTAKEQGYQLLQREDVQAYLQELIGKSEKKHSISKDKWLSELEACGFSNIKDFIGEGNSVNDFSKLSDSKAKAVSSIKNTKIKGEGFEKTTVEFKLHDKLNALDKIGRHFGYFEKDNEQKKNDIKIVIDSTDSQIGD